MIFFLEIHNPMSKKVARTSERVNWKERKSSLKHHVRSNDKHETKKNAPGQTAAQVKFE